MRSTKHFLLTLYKFLRRVLINKPHVCEIVKQGRFMVSNLSGVRITNQVTSKHPSHVTKLEALVTTSGPEHEDVDETLAL